jgi:hypothetical protein
MERRLGWVEPIPCEQYSLIEIVQKFDKVKKECTRHPPVLVHHHPRRNEYLGLSDRDKEGFIRRLLPVALDAFRKFAKE